MEWKSDFAATDTADPIFGLELNGDEDRTLPITVDEPSRGYVVIRVNGDLDVVTAPELGSCLSECVINPSTVLMDLRAVSFVGCAALAVIEATGAFLGDRGERLLVACGRSVRRTLEVSGVDRRVTVLCV
jgi:anti-sigma B factor antagonist